MRTKAEIFLNDRSLDQIDSRIILQKIDEGKPSLKTTAVSVLGGVGQLVTARAREYLEISVEFAIAEKDDMAARAMILGEVAAWAMAGGTLTVNYRPEQMLEVVCQELPQDGYVREWKTNNYKVVFRAYGVPFWQSANKKSVTIIDSGSDLFVPGTARTLIGIDAEITEAVASGSIRTVSVSVEGGDTLSYTLTGPISAGTILRVDYIGSIMRSYMVETDGTETAVGLQSSDNPDVLRAEPGHNTLTMTGDGVTVNAWCRGRWY